MFSEVLSTPLLIGHILYRMHAWFTLFVASIWQHDAWLFYPLFSNSLRSAPTSIYLSRLEEGSQ